MRVGAADRPTYSVDVSEVARTSNFSLRKGVYMEDKFINNQIALDTTEGSCGYFGSVECDGAGAIAIYNLLKMLGKDITFEEVLEVQRRTHSLLFAGLGGMNPFRVRKMLKKFGVRAHYAGIFRHTSQIKEPHKFLIFYFKPGFPYFCTHFQAGKLVRDRRWRIWIQLYNPFHRYINLSQLKEFENLRLIFLFTIEE